jgi:hypothetical protein
MNEPANGCAEIPPGRDAAVNSLNAFLTQSKCRHPGSIQPSEQWNTRVILCEIIIGPVTAGLASRIESQIIEQLERENGEKLLERTAFERRLKSKMEAKCVEYEQISRELESVRSCNSQLIRIITWASFGI